MTIYKGTARHFYNISPSILLAEWRNSKSYLEYVSVQEEHIPSMSHLILFNFYHIYNKTNDKINQ